MKNISPEFLELLLNYGLNTCFIFDSTIYGKTNAVGGAAIINDHDKLKLCINVMEKKKTDWLKHTHKFMSYNGTLIKQHSSQILMLFDAT